MFLTVAPLTHTQPKEAHVVPRCPDAAEEVRDLVPLPIECPAEPVNGLKQLTIHVNVLFNEDSQAAVPVQVLHRPRELHEIRGVCD